MNNLRTRRHLPLYGAGPAYVITITAVTLAAAVLHYRHILPSVFLPHGISLILKIAGAALVCLGALIWCKAVFGSRLQARIKENELVTDGIYAWVRHPVYAAFTLAEWGVLLFIGNIFLFVLIPLYWGFFSILMKYTEEKWLHERFGKEYEEYCSKVNRCIPWIRKS